MNRGKILVKNKEEFGNKLKEWYAVHHRKLPWREEPSTYKTVISEFMLQQTQVETVLPYFRKWLRIFPDFQTLAEASEEEVVKEWEGLGYYSRARNLHKLAKAVSELKELPKTAEGWQGFPGVGPYTSAAIASISYGDRTAVVDGNVIRILARLNAHGEEFPDNGKAVKAFRELAQDLLNEDDANTHNQAMMELGATVCVRQKPMCMICPVVHLCEGAKSGEPELFPKFKKRKIEKVTKNRIWVIDRNKVLLHKIPSGAKRLANMYELPEAELTGQSFSEDQLWKVKKRGISNQRFEESIYIIPTITADMRERTKVDEALHWVGIGELKELTLSGPHRKWINELLEHEMRAALSIPENQ